MEYAKKYSVTLHVRSSFNESAGTIVSEEVDDMEGVVIRGIAHDEGQAKVSIFGVPDNPGVAYKIFDAIASAEINVDMIVQGVSRDGKANISFTVSETELRHTLEIIQGLSDELGISDVVGDENIAKVSAVGIGMRSHYGVAAEMFQALAEANINIQMISTSEIRLSVVVDKKDVKRAVKAVHDKFL